MSRASDINYKTDPNTNCLDNAFKKFINICLNACLAQKTNNKFSNFMMSELANKQNEIDKIIDF